MYNVKLGTLEFIKIEIWIKMVFVWSFSLHIFLYNLWIKIITKKQGLLGYDDSRYMTYGTITK